MRAEVLTPPQTRQDERAATRPGPSHPLCVVTLQVVCMGFFDIVLDFILMDAFEDLENPPSSVLAVLRNRWLSDSFKETVGRHPVPSVPAV